MGLQIGVALNNERHTSWGYNFGYKCVAQRYGYNQESDNGLHRFASSSTTAIDRFWVPNVTDKRKGPNYV